jgi:hypothetical protein
MKVCEKVKAKGSTSYNEVRTVLICLLYVKVVDPAGSNPDSNSNPDPS